MARYARVGGRLALRQLGRNAACRALDGLESDAHHPEGVKGAEAVAGAIFWREPALKAAAIRDHIVTNFGYDLSRSCDEIRPTQSSKAVRKLCRKRSPLFSRREF